MSAILLCLATKKGYEVLRALGSVGAGREFYVCTFRETNVAASQTEAIRGLASELGLTTVSWKQFRDDPIAFLNRHGVKSIVCIGWRYLIPDEVVAHLGGEVIIAHDSLLPKYRGFAPLVTALIAGESEAGVTFLRVGPGVDDGPVLWQKAVPILPRDTISELIDRVSTRYAEGACRYVNGELGEGTPQDHRAATYSIWRDELDFRIDWTEAAARIERAVRALGPPYLGAQSMLMDKLITICRVEEVDDLPFAIRQPGKIWSLDRSGRPTVVCGSGLLRVVEAASDGQSILPLKSLRQRFI